MLFTTTVLGLLASAPAVLAVPTKQAVGLQTRAEGNNGQQIIYKFDTDDNFKKDWIINGPFTTDKGKLVGGDRPGDAGGAKCALKKYVKWPAYKYESKIMVHEGYAPEGNAGVIFAATSLKPGVDQYEGFFFGFRPDKSAVIFGKADDSWTPLKTRENIGLKANKEYTFTITTGKHGIGLALDGVEYIRYTKDDTNITTMGQVGFRTFKTTLRADNLVVTKLDE